MVNKKAVTSPALIIIIFLALAILVCLGIFAFAVGTVDEQISTLDFTFGNDSFNDTYQQLVHPAMEVLSVNGPKIMAIGTLIGMVLVLLFVAMKSDKRSRLWIILDIFIIIVAEIVAVAVRDYFNDYILNLTPELFVVFSTTLAEGSKWILALPIIIPTVGAVLMVATYVLNKEDKEEESHGFVDIDNE